MRFGDYREMKTGAASQTVMRQLGKYSCLSAMRQPCLSQSKSYLSGAANQLSICVREVERSLDSEGEKPRPSYLNEIVSKQRDKIIQVHESLKHESRRLTQ